MGHSNRLQVFRVRLVLQATDKIFMHAFHAGNLYALLAAAQGKGTDGASGVPDGVLLDAPEQCRAQLDPEDSYAFGLTLLAVPDRAGPTLAAIVRGLRLLGKAREAPGLVWGGNFRVRDVADLVADRSWGDGDPLRPVPDDRFHSETEMLAAFPQWTVRFSSPFRSERPRRDQQPGRGFLDRDYFPVETFARRLWDRLAGLELVTGDQPLCGDGRIADNRLHWLDLTATCASLGRGDSPSSTSITTRRSKWYS